MSQGHNNPTSRATDRARLAWFLPHAAVLGAVFALTFCTTKAAYADLTPDTVSVMGGTWHPTKTDRLSNDTPGIALSWRTDAMPWTNGAIDLALYRNSQSHAGLYLGASKEWRVTQNLYLSVGSGVVWGYRKGDLALAPKSHQLGRVVACGHGTADPVCAFEAYGKPKWLPALQLKARYQITDSISAAVTYMPTRVLQKLSGGDNAQKTSDAVSFWLVYQF